MTDQQENILIARLIEFREGSYNPTAMIRIIKSILSPLPHQDGASAEDAWNIAQSILDKCRCEPIYTNRKMVDPNCAWCEYHVDFIQAMHQFAKSELSTANARIAHLEQGMANWVRVSNERQEELNEAERRVKELEMALLSAVGTIRIFHGMGMDANLEPRMWKIYSEQSPEMKSLHAALDKIETK